MINFKSNKGYTLVEVLVGINLALIVITLIVSFYLFSSKFISAFSMSAVEKHEINNSLNNTFELFRNSERFTVIPSEAALLVLFDNKDSLLITPEKISIKNIYEIDDIEEIKFTYTTVDGEETDITINKSQITHADDAEIVYSENIYKVFLSFMKDNTPFSLEIVLPGISGRRFGGLE